MGLRISWSHSLKNCLLCVSRRHIWHCVRRSWKPSLEKWVCNFATHRWFLPHADDWIFPGQRFPPSDSHQQTTGRECKSRERMQTWVMFMKYNPLQNKFQNYNLVRRGAPWEEEANLFLMKYFEAGIERAFMSWAKSSRWKHNISTR